ncbi:MAG: ABC transporter ATP-binding protein [Planctomycetota bacterium]
MNPITIRSLRKEFGKTVAVDGIDLDIAAGQLFFLLGPSGCGKTTLLRMIAGFTDPTSGSIRFGDDDVTHLPPNKRNTGMVFQGYALWPHMTVRQNVAFGLEVRKVAKAEIDQRVDEALSSVQLTVQADRKINQLSGGQQQRVALARALVIKPTVLLLDEPLSNLDAKLRLEMRQSIRDICKASGITGVYVTHDQKEALSMADGVAVLSAGRVMQVGPPRNLYERPANRFVADFLGETNFVDAEVKGREPNGGGELVVLDTPMGVLRSAVFPDELPAAGNVTCSIRPEAIRLTPGNGHAASGSTNTFSVRRAHTVYLGEMAQYHLTTDGDARLKAFELNPRFVDHGDADAAVTAAVAPDDVVILKD